MAGCDAVLETMSHHFKGDRVSEKVQCKIISPVPEGTNVIPTGADLAPGAILVQEGRRITSADLAALCMAGVRELPVYVRPRVAVCVLHKYFQTPIALDAPGANALPDAVSPLVLGLLAQWGVQVDTVRHLNLDNQPYTCATNREVNAVSSEHDLTIVVGFLGSKVEADEIRARARLPLLAEPSIGPVEESYTRHRGMIRPADITHVARANAYWDENAPQDRCNVVMSLRGLPLPILTAMYTQVRPVLDALSGVGAYPVQVREFGFASPGAPDGFNTRRREILGRPAQGQSGRQGVRWLTGVLAASAPRDRERHWLQLARIERGPLGETMLRVLPSEEHQVSGMIGAEAMVGIEKGEGELPAGSIVEYFLLD
jgi:molybdopterin biosynthesis enzyme